MCKTPILQVKLRCGLAILLSCILSLFSFSQAVPVADFSADVVSGCTPLVVRFKDLSSNNPTRWSWDLGVSTSSAQNPTATFINPGIYTIKLTASNNNGSGTVTKAKYITIHALPSIDFFTNDTLGCMGMSAQFTDMSAGGSGTISKWEWNFGDGNTGSGDNPAHVYSNAGTYSVYLKVTNSYGCSKTASKSQYIKVGSSITGSFVSTIPAYCTFPVNIAFDNGNASNPDLTYQWQFGDGEISSQVNPTHSFASPGSYTVSLISQSELGCRDTVQKTLQLAANITSFTVSSPVCKAAPVTFSSSSTPSPVTTIWDMGDGSKYGTPTVKHTYTAAGSYTVKLTTDFGGCIDSVSKTIVVNEIPAVDFSSLETASCKTPFTVHFQHNVAGATDLKWEFGDNAVSPQPNPSHTYTTTGNFNVSLTATNSYGCSVTVNKTSYVNIIAPTATINNLPVYACPPYTYTPAYTINSADSIVSYQWNFGDGTTSTEKLPSHLYPASGSYTVSLQVTTINGCKESIFKPYSVNIGENATVDFDVSTTVACGGSIDFSPIVSPAPDFYVWNFGDNSATSREVNGNATHRYSDTGIYTITLLVNKGGCNTTITKKDIVRVKGPIVKFSYTKDCTEKGKVNFYNNTTLGTNYYWQFGDGETSFEANPVHYYKQDGDFLATLVVSNVTCADTVSHIVPVRLGNATITAKVTTICKGANGIFGINHPNANSIVSYYWNFTGYPKESSIETSTNTITWNFQNAGTYDFIGYVVDSFGCRDSVIKPGIIRVNGATANFTAITTNGCQGNIFTFLDSTVTDGLNAIKKWSWNFGDGAIEAYDIPKPAHKYTLAGIYDVTLKVTDQSGCTDSIIKPSFIAVELGKANFTSLDSLACIGSSVRFSNQSLGNALSYNWEFGDGTTSNILNPIHSYSSAGDYTVKLVINSSTGCSDSIIKNNFITVNNPIAKFSVSDTSAACPPAEIKFTDSSSYVQSYKWVFGDGNISSAKSPLNVFLFPGNYKAKLIVTSFGGCKDSAFQNIAIAGPIGNLTYNPQNSCGPLNVAFKANNVIGALNYSWDFGDGLDITSADSSATHTYTTPGKYIPKVLMKDDKGCVVPYSGADTIFIDELQPAFSASQTVVCDSASVTFFNDSKSITATHTKWYFGDDSYSNYSQPTHSYNIPGKYNVKLVVETAAGCVDSLTYADLIKVVKVPTVSIVSKDTICQGSVDFTASIIPGTSEITSYLWTFGNGNHSNSKTPLTQNFAAGTYNNSVIINTNDGCTGIATKPLNVIALPAVNAGVDTTICHGTSALLVATGAEKFDWIDISRNSTLCNNCQSFAVSPITNTVYKVKGTNSNGCFNYDSLQVHIIQAHKLKTANQVIICKGSPVLLNVTGAHTYSWYPVEGLSDAKISNPIASPNSNTSYQVIGSDTLGCFTDTAIVNATVHDIPTVDLGPDINVPASSVIHLQAITSADVVSYNWIPATNLSCNNCPNPVLTANSNLLYRLRVSNSGGCTAIDSLRVIASCNNSTVFIPNTFSPNNDGMNDVFYPRGKGIHNIDVLRIYNRWGENVFNRTNFSANDPSAAWNGTYNGKVVEPGVYFYEIEFTCTSNQSTKQTGTVSLIR